MRNLLLFFFLCSFLQTDLAQNNDTVYYPRADIHLGLSIINGTYLGSIIQLSNDFSVEASAGGSMGLLFGQPAEDVLIFGTGLNYHLYNFILNLSYSHLAGFDKKGDAVSVNIKLFYIEDPGFHLIGGLGCFYGFNFFDNDENMIGVNWNLALGFTVL